jgi:hypothetical protein
MEDALLKYGLSGIVLLACGLFIRLLINWIQKLIKDNREAMEKKDEEHRRSIEKIFDRMNETNDDTNKALRENTNILSGLKSLLENQKR